MNLRIEDKKPVENRDKQIIGVNLKKNRLASNNSAEYYSGKEVWGRVVLGWSISFIVGATVTMIFILKDLWR